MTHSRRSFFAGALTIAASIAFSLSANAQQVATDPTSTHIFPAGGRRGTKFDVRVGGECLPPATRLRFFGAGVTAPPELGERAEGKFAPSPPRKPGEQHINYPKEWQSRVQIAADAEPGVVLWRLSCGRGGTGGRPFIIGDLPEFIESEPNSAAQEAERVALPVTVNGQIAGESDVDFFQFAAHAGEVVRVDVVAARLGSALDPVVELFDAAGRKVAVEESRAGADPILAFRAPSDGEYRLLVSNVNFHGGPDHVYRITVSTAPLVRFAFPAGGKGGTTQDVEFFALSGDGAALTIRAAMKFPPETGQSSEIWRSPVAGANAVPLVVGDLNESIETGTNDSPQTAMELAWPGVMNGRFETAADEDWYRFTAKKDALLSIDCQGPSNSPVLPIVTVTDANGGPIALANAVHSPLKKARIDWRCPADGDYRLRVRDLQHGSRGGPEFIYRLTVREAVPEFSLFLKTDAVSVLQEGRAEVDVGIEWRGGLAVPIELIVQGLPAGVKIEGNQIAPGQMTAKLAFVADATAAANDVTLKITGKAIVNGQPIERIATATHLGHDADGVGVGPASVDHFQLTVMHKPVFKLYCNEAYQYAHRGTIYRYLMEVERLDGFDGPIRLQVADRQIKDLDGIEIPETTIPPGESQVMLPLYLPESMHINVQAHSNVYAQGYVEFLDKHGQKQTLLVVSTMRCMIRTLPTVTKLRTVDRTLTARPGETVTCRLRLDRTANFNGPMTIELLNAAKTPEISAQPATIVAGGTTADIVLHIASDAAAGEFPLKFRAVGTLEGDVQVVTEAAMPLKVGK